jgi:hypothetical protein
MRLVIALVAAIAVLALAACSQSNGDGPRRAPSGPYIGVGGGSSM